jgi:hypothetical protein
MGGMLLGAGGFIIVALLGLKLAPAYLEYSSVKKAVVGIVQGGEARGTVNDIRRAFDKRAQVDDVSVISGQDLDISKEGSDVVITFAYPKKIPLFGNVSLYIDFAGSSSGG